MRISRKLKFCAGCCWCAGLCSCCSYEVAIESPPGQVIGYVKQGGSFWRSNFIILNEVRNEILKIQGPYFILDGPYCPFDNKFRVNF